MLVAARVCAVVGLDLWLRAYPGGEPVRDDVHADLFAAFTRLLGAGLVIRGEVVIGDARDQRAWDGTIADQDGEAGVQLESRITDGQALVRRTNLKRRDGGLERVVLVLLDTRANRRALRAAEAVLRTEFPLDDAEIRSALAEGRLPGDSGIVFLRPERQQRER